MKFSIKGFFSKYDEILSFLRIWSHLVKKFVMENFIFCAVKTLEYIFVFNSLTLDFHKKVKGLGMFKYV